MSAIAVTPVYNTFLDVDGNPVDDGYVWIGQPNLDPIANPQNAYWDEALTQLVTQPVRTRQGYPLNGSSVGKLYTAGSYSILVRNENGSDVIGAATFSADDVIDDLTLTGTLTLSALTASTALALNANKEVVSVTNTGTGNNVLATGPTIANLTYTGTLTGGTGVVNLGSGQFYKDASGNVGIGTASPGYRLHVVSATEQGAFVSDGTRSFSIINSATAGGPVIGAFSNHPLLITTNNTERMRIDSSGNINIATAGARVTGDFSNATLASRVYFQSSTANGNTGIGALPNGTATTATFTVFNTSDPANSSVGQLAATSTDIRAVSTVTGTGSAVPFKVFVGGGEQIRIGGDSTLRSLGSFAVNTPPLINAATYTTLGTDFSLRFSTTNCTITLPAAATYPGRILIITNVTANSVTSDASNVKPLGSDVAGTTILSASAGKFAFLQSDGSFWITLMAN